MAKRRLLIIGSQCGGLNELRFLPDVAVRLHGLMTDPETGECVGAPIGNNLPSLLLDPTVAEAKRAIRTAIEGAVREGDTLILAYIGHGEFPDERSGDFYLMPTDAAEATADGAIHFAGFIKDCIKFGQGHAGLVILLDACSAGAGLWESMEQWAQSVRGNLSFETADSHRRPSHGQRAR